MKKTFKTTSYGIAAIAFACFTFYSCAPTSSGDETTEKTTNSKNYHVSENDSANIAIAVGYITSLVNGDGSVAQNSVTAGYMSRGPAMGDSATIEQVVASWATNASQRTNQDAGIQAQSGLTVTEGPLAGDWVHLWGIYTATDTESGKALSVPWHGAYKIQDGKISWSRSFYDNLAPYMELGRVMPAK
jgi:hypothetical protein